jgi:hypothetical protein
MGTRVLIAKGLPIDMVCKVVKNYQRCYIAIKDEDPQLSRAFPFEKYLERLIKNKFECV